MNYDEAVKCQYVQFSKTCKVDHHSRSLSSLISEYGSGPFRIIRISNLDYKYDCLIYFIDGHGEAKAINGYYFDRAESPLEKLSKRYQ